MLPSSTKLEEDTQYTNEQMLDFQEKVNDKYKLIMCRISKLPFKIRKIKGSWDNELKQFLNDFLNRIF